MQASIDERHLKDFVRLLQCASKYGDELCIHANQELWELAVRNSSSSAFCLFRLQPEFFSRYQALGSPSERRKGVKCSLLVKSVLAVLGKASSVSSIERLDLAIRDPKGELRTVPSTASNSSASANGSNSNTTPGLVTPQRSNSTFPGFDDNIDDDPTSRESVLIVRLVCKHGVTKMHTLNLAKTDFNRVDIDPDSTPSSFTISARTLRNWLDHFSLTSSNVSSTSNQVKAENQLGWMFGKNEVRLKSWEGASKDLCTEIKVDVAEFGHDSDGMASYWVEQDRVDLTLPMKEFRATLQLADSMNIDLTVAFSQPSQPLTMVYTGGLEDNFDIFCAIATMHCEAFPLDLGKPGNGGQAPPRPPGGLDPAGRRIVSDLTDDGNPGGPAGDEPEGSRKRRSSEAPQSQAQRRRGMSKLDLTPSGNRSASAQAAVVYGTPLRGTSSRSTGNPGPSQGGGGGGGEGVEPLFMPGGSQEEDNGAPAAPSSQRMVMSQQEVLAMAGMDGMEMEDLLSELDQAEDEEYTASQAARRKRGNGEVGGVDAWDDADLRAEGELFEADDSVFESLAFEPPPESSLPTPRAQTQGVPQQRRDGREGRTVLGERSITSPDIRRVDRIGRGGQGGGGSGSGSGSRGNGNGPPPPAAAAAPAQDRSGDRGPARTSSRPPGRSTTTTTTSSHITNPSPRSYPPARVRSETEEDREMRGVGGRSEPVGREGQAGQGRGGVGGSASSDSSRGGAVNQGRGAGGRGGQGGMGNGASSGDGDDDDDDEDDEELGATQPDYPSDGSRPILFPD